MSIKAFVAFVLQNLNPTLFIMNDVVISVRDQSLLMTGLGPEGKKIFRGATRNFRQSKGATENLKCKEGAMKT